MKRLSLIFALLLLGAWWVSAEDPYHVPPIPDPALFNYLRKLQSQQRTLAVVTTNPNGNRQGTVGDLVVYNNSGSYKICLNINSGPSGGTSWQCTANAFTAP